MFGKSAALLLIPNQKEGVHYKARSDFSSASNNSFREVISPRWQRGMMRVELRKNGLINTDWTSVIIQSLLRQIELNTCIHRHLPLYDFSNIGLFYKSQWYYTDWTSVIIQSLLRQIELNTCIHRHLPLYDFSNIGLFYKSQWYYVRIRVQVCDCGGCHRGSPKNRV